MSIQRVHSAADRDSGPERTQAPNRAAQAQAARQQERVSQPPQTQDTAVQAFSPPEEGDGPVSDGFHLNLKWFEEQEQKKEARPFNPFEPQGEPQKAGEDKPDDSSLKSEVRKKKLSVLQASLSELGQGDERLNKDDVLRLAQGSPNPEVRDAAQYFIDNQDALTDLDVSGDSGKKNAPEDILARQRQLQ